MWLITTPTMSCVVDLDKLNLIIEIISPIPASRVSKNIINLLFCHESVGAAVCQIPDGN